MKIGMKVVSFVLLVVALLATASISWAAGYQYNLGCNGCHGVPPLDDSTRNPLTGGFVGNHQTHMGTAPATTKCDICHYDAAVTGQTKPSTYSSGHYTGKIQMFGKYAKGTFFNQTSIPNMTNATCSSVNCHFESVTPTWGTAPLAGGPNDCNICHAFPPATGQSGTAHTTHTTYLQAQGQFSVCDNCHGDHRFEAKPFQHATSAGQRPIYTLPTIKYTGAADKYLPSQAGQQVFGKCSNIYCHSNGNPAPATQGYVSVAYKAYTTPVFGTTGNGCGICHAAAPTTNAHSRHVGALGYGCVLCHSTTVSNNTTISSKANHDNGVKNVAFSGIAGTGSTCSTSYCHSSMTGTATAPVWTAQNSAACGSCHFASNSTLATKAHSAHLNSAAAAYGPTALQGSAAPTSCQACHTTYVNNGATHVNGAVDVTLSACNPCHVGSMTTTIWGSGRVTCESCHTGTTRSVIQGVTAPDMTLSSTKGHTQSTFTGAPTCASCHNANAAHISGVLGDAVRLTLANDNTQCASCHNAGKTIAQFQNMSTHFTTYGGPQNMLCKACHNPHGSTNRSMIRTQLKGAWANATTYTITYTTKNVGLVDQTTNRGLCQVCHSKTKYWRAGVPETGHPTSGCLDCHSHRAAGGAFKPNGSCDGCHGYPPVPKGLAGLTFGTAGNYANGRFEDYSGGGGAHAIAAHVNPNAVPAQGWANCAMCHNSGLTGSSSFHKAITPIKTNIANVTIAVDPKLKFNATKMINYSGAKLVYPGNKTGQCSNVECHFKPSPRWSISR